MTKRIAPALVAALALTAGSALSGSEIHGTVHLRDGSTYTGPMRWSKSESFWNDFLDATKPGVIREDGERKSLKVLFWKVADLDHSRSSFVRSFTIPFGELTRIEPARGDTVDLTLRNGEVVTVSQWYTDLGPSLTLQVDDADEGPQEVPWKRIDVIEFSGDGTAGWDDRRLYGTVKTSVGSFTGYILWDRDEAMHGDTLDGEANGRERDVDFGDIASIERASSRSALVTLRDGEEVELRGTNDVNREIRGIDIMVEDLGRVTVDWDLFERVDFTPAPPSPGYDTFDGGRPLRGEVTMHDGRVLTGRIVWDEDEEYDWEVLDGIHEGVDYEIFFEHIHSIMPGSEETARVRLRSGELLVLDSHKDVSVENEGIVVHTDDGEQVELRWWDVRLVRFEP